MFALAALAALIATVPLSADPSFQDGKRLYSELEFEQAIFRFQEAALNADHTPADQAQIQLWLGVSYAKVGHFDNARRAFDLGLKLDRDAQLPAKVSPKVTELFESVRQALPPPEPKAPEPAPKAPEPAPKAPEPKAEAPAPTASAPATSPAPAPQEVVGPSEEPPLSTWTLGAAGLGAVGAATVVGAGAAATYALLTISTARDVSTPQVDVPGAVQRANLALMSAGVLGGTSLLLGVGASALAVLGFVQGNAE